MAKQTGFERVIRWGSFLVFAINWTRLLLYSISSWHALSTGLRLDLFLILVFFAGLTMKFMNSREDFHDALITAFTLSAVSDFIRLSGHITP